ncbi:HWE histidine kinase domain-containing protein [Phenylobacterium sp.]|uniref:HWE histidine kinase domain-containing protein n=1 Tax=Phenylobacterium sp. TaxID=1871053 RepID=UPI0011F512F5|nr:HWE histidine kinase domain-containing protein [Phenylobacterium sp.]THD60415.1 MAG: PAS domain S-box protein [Phenylobacterium sp.]
MTSGELGHSEEHRRLELALKVAGLGEFEWDMARGLLMVSERMSAITGFPVGPMAAETTRDLQPFIHADDWGGFRGELESQRPAGRTYEVEYRHIRPDDGRTVWVRVAGVVARDAAGKALRVTGIVEDITPRKVEETQRQTLMAELDHRVKNVLATVQALAVQTARRTTSLDAFLANFGGRLKALGSANELLTAARWRGAAIDHLAAAELGALAPGQTAWEGPELFLTARAANALALGLHELAANALKFGALSVETGRVNLRWARLADGGFELTWTESGGPRVNPPTRRGFGSALLEQVTSRELNGETSIDFHPAGVVARLRAGSAAVAPRPAATPAAPPARIAETVVTASGPVNLRGARVLIVEDAVLLAMELETGLSDAGAQVIGPAYELEEAMALLDQPIDAAVLDANLNGHSVLPVAEVLAKRRTPFLFATGYGEASGAPGGFDAPVIRKPYDVTQVAAAVAELLAGVMPHP